MLYNKKTKQNKFFVSYFYTFFFSFSKFLFQNFLNISRNISLRFEVLISKNLGGDRFLVKYSFFAGLVCAYYKEPIIASDFNWLYLKNYFEF